MRARLDALGVPVPAAPRGRRRRRRGRPSPRRVGGFPVVLKTTRGGYDGKGVWVVDVARTAAPTPFAVAGVDRRAILAEEKVDFRRELSALVARSPSGQVAAYPVVESVQRDGICFEVIAPAPDLDRGARRRGAADRDAGRRRARRHRHPRGRAVRDRATAGCSSTSSRCARTTPGTGRMDGAVTGQFENHLRAVLDLPLGVPDGPGPLDGDGQHPRRRHGALSENLYGGYPHVLGARPARSRCTCTART